MKPSLLLTGLIAAALLFNLSGCDALAAPADSAAPINAPGPVSSTLPDQPVAAGWTYRANALSGYSVSFELTYAWTDADHSVFSFTAYGLPKNYVVKENLPEWSIELPDGKTLAPLPNSSGGGGGGDPQHVSVAAYREFPPLPANQRVVTLVVKQDFYGPIQTWRIPIQVGDNPNRPDLPTQPVRQGWSMVKGSLRFVLTTATADAKKVSIVYRVEGLPLNFKGAPELPETRAELPNGQSLDVSGSGGGGGPSADGKTIFNEVSFDFKPLPAGVTQIVLVVKNDWLAGPAQVWRIPITFGP